MKFYDVHFQPDPKSGYSVFVEAEDEENAIEIIKVKEMYEYEEDLNYIDYIEEISEDEYNEIKGI